MKTRFLNRWTFSWQKSQLKGTTKTSPTPRVTTQRWQQKTQARRQIIHLVGNKGKPAANESPSQQKRPAIRSHHTKKACSVPGCKFFGSDLKRHLKTHARKGEIAEENIAQVATIVSSGKKQRGKSVGISKSGKRKLGRKRKWCPVPGCSSIVLNVGRHLTNCHAIKKDTTQYRICLKEVRPYTGMSEMEHLLIKPSLTPTASKQDSGEDTEEETALRSLTKGRGRARSSQKYARIYSDDEAQQQSKESESEELESENKSSLSSEDSEYKNQSDISSSSSYSSCDETEVSNVSAEKYYTQTKPENPRHQWLIGFYDYLSRPAMGDKKKAICLQHAGQMRTLLEHLDPKGKDITCLALDEGDAVWKRWVDPTLSSGSRKAGTVISYLTSFEKYLAYVTNQRYNRSGPPIDAKYIDIFKQVLPVYGGRRNPSRPKPALVGRKRHLVDI